MKDQAPEEILKNMRSLKKWIQGRMTEIDHVLKMKRDLEYYQHQTAQLMVRVERLEKNQSDKQTLSKIAEKPAPSGAGWIGVCDPQR